MTEPPCRSRSLAFLAAVVLGGGPTKAAGQPFTVQGPGVNPDEFRVTVFAQGLNFPFGMISLSDGSLVVATSDTTGSFFNSTGVLLRLEDADGDGVADGTGTILFDGLQGPLTALQQAGSLVFVTSPRSGAERITVLRRGAAPEDPYQLVGTLNFAFPSGWEHTTYALAARRVPLFAPYYDVFFNIGSSGNHAQTTATVGLTGLITGSLQGASIYKVTFLDSVDGPKFSQLLRIASGLRNAAGITIDPGDGALYFEDNGIDSLPDRNEPLSADELNWLPRSKLGGNVEGFGFPTTYVEYRTGRLVGTKGRPPLVAFQPIPPPDGSESEGAVQIALAPALFPSPVHDGIFIGFHGRSGLAGLENEENPLVFWNRATGQYFYFISNDEPGIGHLDALLATADSLFVADLNSSGALSGFGGGVIYQIKAR